MMSSVPIRNPQFTRSDKAVTPKEGLRTPLNGYKCITMSLGGGA